MRETGSVTSGTLSPAEAGRLMRRATYAATALAVLLIAAKFSAWLLTGSVALLASLADSMLDAAASMVNLLAVRHALQPADREHRFGHGKAEPLAALAQAAFIIGSAALLGAEAFSRLLNPAEVRAPELGVAVMLFSIVATMVLVAYQRSVIRRTRSLAISADSLHYAGDLLINGAVIAALVLQAWLGWRWVDPVFAIAIALFLALTATQIARSALDMLMDRELGDADRQRIREIAHANPAVRAVHDLRTRVSGRTPFIQFHLELDGAMTLRRAHEISDEVERDVLAAFPDAEIIIHQDPEGVEEPRARFA